MKRFYLLGLIIAVFALPLITNGQENLVKNPGFESWDDENTPTDWNKYENISQCSTVVYSGNYSAAQTSASSSKRLRQNVPGVVPGTEYTVSFWYLDNDPHAKCRIWSYWLDESGSTMDADADKLRPSTYTTDNPDWQQFVVQVTAPEGAAKLRFEVRTYKEGGNTGGVVYFDDFYLGTEVIVLPEPSNYPSDFSASTYKVFIDLSWEDATGDQLPTAYLIYGAKQGTELPVPVDGTPVDTDFDWSDGIAAVNVLYGLKSIRVKGLDPDTQYSFAIYPYTNSGENIDYKTDGTAPVSSATTENMNLLNYEDFETGNFNTWNPYNVSGEQVWEVNDYNDNHFAKMNGYASGASHVNEDWIISDPISLSADHIASFTFSNSKKYEGNDLELYLSTDYDGSGNPNDFNWTNLSDQALWSPGNYEWVITDNLDLSAYAGSTVYLGFKYTSTDQNSAIWKLDELIVLESITSGVGENSYNNFNIYPNPSQGTFNFNSEEDGILNIISVSGKVLLTGNVKKGNNMINCDKLHNGVYIVNIKLNNNITKTTKLVIE
jgi:hypothetical protein